MKPTPKSTLFLLVLLLAGLTACRSNDTSNSSFVKQSEIHQEYSLTQEQGGNITATAQFRFGGNSGTTLILDKNAGVLFNGGTMSPTTGMINLDGTYYTAQVAASDQTKYTWVWTDNDNKTYTNSLSINRVAFQLPVSRLDKNKGIDIKLVGPPLETGEEIRFELRDSSGNYIMQLLRPDGNALHIKFEPSEMAGLYPGPCTMMLYRKMEKKVDQGTNLGGVMKAHYSVPNKEVMLEGPMPPTGPNPSVQ